MKYFVLIAQFFLFNALSNGQCMSGTYSIGSNAADNYTTIELAVGALVSNGMCGPVEFEIRNGVYNTALDIPAISGNSPMNRLTIRSMSGTPGSVTLTRGTSPAADNYTIRISGATNVELKNLTIRRTSTSNYTALVTITDTMHRAAFTNVVYSGPSNMTSVTAETGSLLSVYSKIDSLLIDQCVLNYGYYGIYNYTLTSDITYFDVRNSEFNYPRLYAVNAPKWGEEIIFKETFFQHLVSNGNSSTKTFSATGYPGNILLDGNKIFHSDGNNSIPNSETIYITAPFASTPKVVIINNYIDNRKTYMNSIQLSNVDSVFVSNNTLKAVGTNEIYSNCGYVEHFNNISDNSSTNKNLVVNNVANWNSDYNCYYTIPASVPFSFNSVDYSTLSAFSTAVNQEQQSLFHSPSYINAYVGDVHLYDVELDNKGIQLSYVTEDFDHQLRQDPPDIGCDEYTAPAIDAKLFEFTNYGAHPCPELLPLTCKVKNSGTNTISSIAFKVTSNGIVQGIYTWSGTIASSDTMEIDVTDFNFEDLQTYSIQLEIVQVNGQSDAIALNNSLTGNFSPKMSGVYTIGAASEDFLTLYDAYSSLYQRKTCGTVILELIDGIHDSEIPSNYTLYNLNQDSIIVRPKHAPINGDYTAALSIVEMVYSNCGKWFFEDLVIHNTANNDDIFKFTNSNDIGFSHCVFKSPVDNTSAISPLGGSHIRFDNSAGLKITHCRFEHGHVALYSVNADNLWIEKCDIRTDVGGIYLYQADTLTIIDNDLSAYNAIDKGLSIVDCRNFLTEKNRLNYFNGSALYIKSCSSGFANSFSRRIINNTLIVNNADVVWIDDCDDIRFEHNSLLGLNTGGAGTFSLIRFSTNPSSGSASRFIYIRNNVYVNRNSGPVYYGVLPTNSPVINYNAYNNAPSLTLHNVQTTLALWQGIGHDLNALTTTVPYISNTDLHITPSALFNMALPLAYVTVDHDNRARTATPSVGAFELVVDLVDVKLITGNLPSSNCGTDDQFLLYFTNLGPDTLFEAHFSGRFNAEDTLFIGWEGNLAADDTAFVDFGIADNFLDSINNPKFAFIPLAYQSDPNTPNHLYTHSYVGKGMSGDYIIGGDQPDFYCLSEAVEVLKKRGMCDTVQFLLHHEATPGTADPQTMAGAPNIDIDSIAGLPQNLLVIKALDPAPEMRPHVFPQVVIRQTANVVIQGIAFDAQGYSTVSNLNGYLNVSSDFNYNIRAAIYVADTTNNITVDNCYFHQTVPLYHAPEAIVFGNGHHSDIFINNNQFIGISKCVMSKSNAYFNNVVFAHNSRNAHYEYPVPAGESYESDYDWLLQMEHVDNLVIDGNTDDGSFNQFNTSGNQQGTYSLKLEDLTGNIVISNNRLYRDCDLWYVEAPVSNPAKIYNNFFISRTSQTSIVTLMFVENCDVYHNSFKGSVYYDADPPPANSGSNSESPLSIQHCQNIRLEKNWFRCNFSYYLSQNPGVWYCDNNLFKYAPTLIAAFDQTSTIGDPPITSETDMHLNQNTIFPFLSPNTILSHPTDIDGEPRNTSNSMFGADEYSPHSYNLSALDFTDTLFCPGIAALEVRVANYGLQAVDSFKLMYIIDDTIQGSIDIVQHIDPNTIENVPFIPFTIGSKQIRTINVWPVLPNGFTDSYIIFDSTDVRKVYGAVVDTMNVGANQEYLTLQSAADTLKRYGICDTVWVRLQPGLYLETVQFNNVHMSDPVNNLLVIESVLNDSASVTVKGVLAGPYDYGLRLKDMHHVVVQDLTFTSATHADVYIDGNSDDISLFRNHIYSAGSATNVEINTGDNASTERTFHILDNNMHGGLICMSVPLTSGNDDHIFLHRNRLYPFQSGNFVITYRSLEAYGNLDIRENHLTDFSKVSTNDSIIIDKNYFSGLCGTQLNSQNGTGYTRISNNQFSYYRPSGGWTEHIFEINPGLNHTVYLTNNSLLFHSPAAINGGMIIIYSSQLIAENNQFISKNDETILYSPTFYSNIIFRNNNMRTNGTFFLEGANTTYSFAQYMGLSPNSVNNISVDPGFLNDTVLIPDNYQVMNTGPVHATTTDDILMNNRGLLTDIGAYEASTTILDVALIDYFVEPFICNDSVALYVILDNQGGDTVQQLNLDFTFDSHLTTIDSALLLAGQTSDTLFIGNFAVQNGSNYNYNAAIAAVNGGSDYNSHNDTISGIYQHQQLYFDQFASVCSGDSLLFNNTYISQAGLYYDTLPSVLFGCDSIIRLNINILPVIEQAIPVTICTGETYWFDNQQLSTAGDHIFHYQTVSGCDSLVTVQLSLINYIDTQLNFLICSGDTLSVNGNEYWLPGTYLDTVVYANTCDTIFHYSVAFTPGDYIYDTLTICQGDSVLINNQYEQLPGTYFESFTNANGCESTREIIVEVTENDLDTNVSVSGSLITSAFNTGTYQWMNCTTNQLVANATGQSFNVVVSGEYAVIISNGGCVDTSSCHFVTGSISTTNLFSSNIEIYPNPTAGIVNYHSSVLINSFSIYDYKGRKVIQRDHLSEFDGQIDLSPFSDGMYLIELHLENDTVLRKKIIHE